MKQTVFIGVTASGGRVTKKVNFVIIYFFNYANHLMCQTEFLHIKPRVYISIATMKLMNHLLLHIYTEQI